MNYKPTSRVDALLSDLMVGLGWYMAGDRSALYEDPRDVEAVIDAVLVADGRDPRLAIREDRRQIRDLVVDWMFDPNGRGAQSGLPMTPPAGSRPTSH